MLYSLGDVQLLGREEWPGSVLLSKQGSTPTPRGRGLRDQIQKWALQAQKTLYF